MSGCSQPKNDTIRTATAVSQRDRKTAPWPISCMALMAKFACKPYTKTKTVAASGLPVQAHACAAAAQPTSIATQATKYVSPSASDRACSRALTSGASGVRYQCTSRLWSSASLTLDARTPIPAKPNASSECANQKCTLSARQRRLPQTQHTNAVSELESKLSVTDIRRHNVSFHTNAKQRSRHEQRTSLPSRSLYESKLEGGARGLGLARKASKHINTNTCINSKPNEQAHTAQARKSKREMIADTKICSDESIAIHCAQMCTLIINARVWVGA